MRPAQVTPPSPLVAIPLYTTEQRAILEHFKLTSQEQAKVETEHDPVPPDYEFEPPRYADKRLVPA